MEYIKIKENEAKHYIYEFEGKYPVISDKAYVFSTAFLSGDVEVKDYASVWPCVSMRGDVNKIVVGKYSNIQDNCCLHVADDHACIVGDYVTVGHSVTLHACTIEDHCLIGMGSTVLDGTKYAFSNTSFALIWSTSIPSFLCTSYIVVQFFLMKSGI